MLEYKQRERQNNWQPVINRSRTSMKHRGGNSSEINLEKLYYTKYIKYKTKYLSLCGAKSRITLNSPKNKIL
jgi:hypothetical protein